MCAFPGSFQPHILTMQADFQKFGFSKIVRWATVWVYVCSLIFKFLGSDGPVSLKIQTSTLFRQNAIFYKFYTNACV